MKVIVYSNDNAVISLMSGLLESKGEVIIPNKEQSYLEEPGGQLILIDHAYPYSFKLLNKVKETKTKDTVIAFISFNPLAVIQFPPYSVDAFLLKPLQVEAVQALLVGVEARLGL